jgi:hypothetical protein
MIFEPIPLLGVIATATALIVGVVAAVAATAVSVVSAQRQGQAAKEAGKFNAKVAANNAKAAEQAAAYEAAQIRRKNLLRLGSQRAIGAKSGVALDSGGSLDDVIMDSSIQGELDAQAALYAGQVRATREKAAGQLSIFEGEQAESAANMQSAGAIIGGLGGVAGSLGNYASNSARNNPPPRVSNN